MRGWGLKLTAVGIALLLSYFVNSEENSTVYTFTAPVDLRLPAERVVVGGGDLRAQVTVRGPSFVVSRIPAAPPAFRAVVPDGVDDDYRLQLRTGDLDLPPYVRVVSIEPSEIVVQLDKLAERSIPINIPLLGSSDVNYRVSEVVARPETVVVRGPTSVLSGIAVLQTEPVDIGASRKGFTRSVPLRLPSGILGLSPEAVTVEVKIGPIEIERIIAGLPVEVRSVAGDTYALTPPTVSVDVRGRKDLVASLDRDHVIPFVRLGKDLPDREVVEVSVELPSGLVAARVDPSTVAIIRSPRGTKRRP